MRIDTPAGRQRLVGLTASFATAATLLPGAAASSTPGAVDDRLRTMLLAPAPVITSPPRPAATAPRPAAPRAGRFPIRGKAGFGDAVARYGNDRGSHSHAGQDVFAPAGAPLVAVHDSVVVEVGGGDARGHYVVLYNRRANRSYLYFHMQAPARVRRGQRVRAGRVIGRVGCTGRCSGDHLHFEIHRGRGATGASIDPLPMLKRWRRAADNRS